MPVHRCKCSVVYGVFTKVHSLFGRTQTILTDLKLWHGLIGQRYTVVGRESFKKRQTTKEVCGDIHVYEFKCIFNV